MGTFRGAGHLVWSTKYRYKLLRGELQLRVREVIRQVCTENGVEILIRAKNAMLNLYG